MVKPEDMHRIIIAGTVYHPPLMSAEGGDLCQHLVLDYARSSALAATPKFRVIDGFEMLRPAACATLPLRLLALEVESARSSRPPLSGRRTDPRRPGRSVPPRCAHPSPHRWV